MPISENANRYLHEIASACNTPSGMTYMQNGKRVESLGGHEHWNNDEDRQYSRNPDPVKSKRIELIYTKLS